MPADADAALRSVVSVTRASSVSPRADAALRSVVSVTRASSVSPRADAALRSVVSVTRASSMPVGLDAALRPPLRAKFSLWSSGDHPNDNYSRQQNVSSRRCCRSEHQGSGWGSRAEITEPPHECEGGSPPWRRMKEIIVAQ